jgi:hypothetical protein
VAVIAPLPYAATRMAWAFGIPIGIDDEVLRAALTQASWSPAGALALVATGGALLTTGLSARWGEVFPRWLPILGNQRVPPALAIVPATIVSILVFASGLSVLRDTVRDLLRGESGIAIDLIGTIWPMWGISLAAATLAYYYRRRGRCEYCA